MWDYQDLILELSTQLNSNTMFIIFVICRIYMIASNITSIFFPHKKNFHHIISTRIILSIFFFFFFIINFLDTLHCHCLCTIHKTLFTHCSHHVPRYFDCTVHQFVLKESGYTIVNSTMQNKKKYHKRKKRKEVMVHLLFSLNTTRNNKRLK